MPSLPNHRCVSFIMMPCFKSFLCEVLGEEALYPYADPLSSINLHYAPNGRAGLAPGQLLFAITLLVQNRWQAACFST